MLAVLPGERIGHSKHPLPTTHGQHQKVNTTISLILFFAAKYRETL